MIGTILSIMIPLACIGAILYYVVGARTTRVTLSTSERPSTEPEHHPTPAAAPAAAGHGGAHADHDHGHGKLPWSSQVIAVAVVLSCIGLVVFAFVSWANQQAKASVIDHAPPPAVSSSAVLTEDRCSASPDPASVEEINVPVEGVSQRIEAPDGYRNCYGPYDLYQKLRFKSGSGSTPPEEWANEPSRYKWLGIKPGESSEPITVKRWIVPMG